MVTARDTTSIPVWLLEEHLIDAAIVFENDAYSLVCPCGWREPVTVEPNTDLGPLMTRRLLEHCSALAAALDTETA